MRVAIEYIVPVTAIVDLDDESVSKVTIHGGCIKAAPCELRTEDECVVEDPQVADRARQIADDTIWPVWEHC